MAETILSQARIGKNLSEAMRHDFFVFFHLRVSNSQARDGGSIISYRPQSPQFRERVVVTVDVDDQGRFHWLQLAVNRSVVNDDASENSAHVTSSKASSPTRRPKPTAQASRTGSPTFSSDPARAGMGFRRA